MRAFVHDRWFPFIEVSLIFLAGLWWYVGADSLTIEPLFIALIPWGMRIGAGEFPFRRTRVDWFVFLFMATAFISIFFAYDLHQASIKLYILLAAVLLFYALLGLSRHDVWWLAIGLSALSAGTVGYFLMTNNWVQLPADIGFINQIGLRLMQIRPSLPISPIHANSAGGIIAMLIPFQVALLIYSRRVGHRLFGWIAFVLGGISLGGLLFTSSRGAWGALAIASFTGVLWLVSRWVSKKLKCSPLLMFGFIIIVVFALAAIAVFMFSDRILASQTLNSRFLLDKASLELIFDYPFFGAGLAGFGGQYSQYIYVVPVFQFNYGHFFWLDVIFEQGILGLIAFLGVYIGSFWLLYRTSDQELVGLRKSSNRRRKSSQQSLELGLFRWAIMLSLMTILAHSFIDDTLYAYLGSPFLFLLPGLCLFVAKERSVVPQMTLRDLSRSRVFVTSAGLFVVMVVTAVIFYKPIAANWLAMRGAVSMAKIELEWWPTGEWDTGDDVETLMPAAAYFEQALTYDPNNRTANHRLGLIAMLNRDYDTAVSFLETAYQADSDHRGIIKNLGYSYVWQGEFDKAMPLLAEIDESNQEMDEYSRWWGQQERPDLAYRAATMLQLQP
ncbi:MAG: hypothetical protein DWQ04_16050 [Chloroflexi bacterium]|nr:MAG: hypothetical protein DWQ04_16050 [Chloroflexota bacterium]